MRTVPTTSNLVPILIWNASLIALLLIGFALGFRVVRSLVPAAGTAAPTDTQRSTSLREVITTIAAATATASATAEPLPLPTLTPPRLGTALHEITGALIHSSAFNQYENWEAYFGNSYGANGLDNGVYAFELIRAETLYDLYPDLAGREFLISADIQLRSGRGRQGFLLNYVGEPTAYRAATFTRVTIDSNGAPLVEEVSPAGIRNIPFAAAAGSSVAPLTDGALIRLSAAVSTEGLLLYVNGNYLGRAAVSPPQAGYFGMIAISELDGGFYRAEFDNLTIHNLRRNAFDS